MSAPSPRPTEPEVLVVRSKLDADVWVAMFESAVDHEHPGRLRSVQRRAEELWAHGPVRWQRIDPDTWGMIEKEARRG